MKGPWRCLACQHDAHSYQLCPVCFCTDSSVQAQWQFATSAGMAAYHGPPTPPAIYCTYCSHVNHADLPCAFCGCVGGGPKVGSGAIIQHLTPQEIDVLKRGITQEPTTLPPAKAPRICSLCHEAVRDGYCRCVT